MPLNPVVLLKVMLSKMRSDASYATALGLISNDALLSGPWRAVRRLVKCIQPIDQQHSLQTYRSGPIEPCERIQIEWVRYGRPVDTVHVRMPLWILRDIRRSEDG